MSEITRILEAAQRGEPSAASELLPLVYGESMTPERIDDPRDPVCSKLQII